MNALIARMQWVIDHRGLSRSGWSKAAGMSQGNVGQIMRGERQGNMPQSTFDRLAKAADVDPVWLATGEGTPQGDDDWDIYPSRSEAIELLRAEGCPDGVLNSLRKHSLRTGDSGEDRDPGRSYWLDLAETLISDHRRVRSMLGKVDSRLD